MYNSKCRSIVGRPWPLVFSHLGRQPLFFSSVLELDYEMFKYCIANFSELEAERIWAAFRPPVMKGAVLVAKYNDEKGSLAASLSSAERNRLARALPNKLIELGQGKSYIV